MASDKPACQSLIRVFMGMDVAELELQISEALGKYPLCEVGDVAITSHRDSLVALVALRLPPE